MTRRALPLALLIGLAAAVAGCGPAVTITVLPSQRPDGRVSNPSPPKVVPSAQPVVVPDVPAPTAPQPVVRTGGADGGILQFSWLRLAPATQLSIPAIGLNVPVEEVASAVVDGRWSWPVPLDAAGHHLGTANPGEPGNVVISGHVNTRAGAGIFAQLSAVKPGDLITLKSASGEFSYRVDAITVVPESDVSVLAQGSDEELTLITCVPDGVYQTRLIVHARRA